MLQSHHRRQHPSEIQNLNNLSLHDLPLRNSTSSSQFLAPVPAESDVAKLSHSPSSTLESSPAISSIDFSETSDYYMPRGFSHGQPTRAFLPTSRPASTQPTSNSLQSFDHAQSAQQAPSWIPPNNAAHLASQPRFQQQFHKRTSSDSTAASAGPQSPYTPVSTAGHPYIVDAESQQYLSQHLENFDQHSLPSVTSYPKALPTSQAPLSDALFFSPQFQNYSPQYGHDQWMWEQAMRDAMTQQRQHQQGPRQDGHSMSQSSGYSRGNSEGNANVLDGSHSRRAMERNRLPNLDRTMSDVYQDELYNPAEPTVPAPISKPSTPTLKIEREQASPRNSVFSERLHAAGQQHISARSASPTIGLAREKSPFRPHSQYAAQAPPPPRLGSASHVREQQQAEAAAAALAQQGQRRVTDNQKTVSPKEVSLEYEPEDEGSAPLVPRMQSPPHASARSQRPSKLKQELTRPEQQSFDATAQLRHESSSNMSGGSIPSSQNSVPQVPQQYPFVAQQRRREAPRSQTSVPQFPQHSLSMESTKSEPQSDRSRSSSHSQSSQSEVQRPAHTTADTGTYTCTYHGCTQRFETPTKLQKHKRDGHRQGTPSSAGADSRGTQAGPHKCERINPITNKPCNSVFSRPYDLTRHEDTIHNMKKQKVKCQLCTDEKTFSRSDALTRHMRVVHPEVDFPGKIKRGRV